MPSNEYRSDIVHPESLSAQDADAWLQFMLSNTALRTSFLSLAFVKACAACFDDVRVCRISKGDRVVAFFPFQFASRLHRSSGIACRVAGELSDYFGLVAERNFHTTPDDLLALCGLNAMPFTHLDDGQAEFGLTGENPEIGHRIDFPHGGEKYWEVRKLSDRKFASDTERRARKLVQELGPVRLTFKQKDWASFLDSLIAAKRAQYARTRVSDALDDPRARALLYRLGETSDPMCQSAVSTLYAGETWIASHFGLVCGTTLHFWFPVYNPAARTFSPGRQLLKAIIEASQDIGLTRIDRGAGDSEAKRDFATSQHHYRRGVWARPNAISAVYRVGLSVRWRLNAQFSRAQTMSID